MTPSLPPTLPARAARLGLLCGIPLLVLASYVVPLFGVAISLTLPIATHAARRDLWPHASATSSATWSWLAWAGLWFPGVLSVVGPFQGTEGEGGGLEVSTLWLVMPLCGPDSINALLLPALAAAVIGLGGVLGTVATQRAWAWVAALWLAPWAHHAVFSLIGPEWVC